MVALKPVVSFEQAKLLPSVMSFSADAAVEYSHGFSQPRTDLPAAMSWSLSRPMTLANVGAEQLVPLMPNITPTTTISNSHPYAATSGYPRPEAL